MPTETYQIAEAQVKSLEEELVHITDTPHRTWILQEIGRLKIIMAKEIRKGEER